MTLPSARSTAQRRRDAWNQLEHDVDAWVAPAGPDGMPYLVPLCFLWDGNALLIATRSANPTSRNLLASRQARVAVGHTRDVLLLEATALAVPAVELTTEVGDAYAAKTGWDPRTLAIHHTFSGTRPGPCYCLPPSSSSYQAGTTPPCLNSRGWPPWTVAATAAAQSRSNSRSCSRASLCNRTTGRGVPGRPHRSDRDDHSRAPHRSAIDLMRYQVGHSPSSPDQYASTVRYGCVRGCAEPDML
jgi:hypothetical protein